VRITRSFVQRLIKARLNYFLESNSLISSKQSGFRNNRGAADNLLFFAQKSVRLWIRANKFVVFSLTYRRHLTKSGIKVSYSISSRWIFLVTFWNTSLIFWLETCKLQSGSNDFWVIFNGKIYAQNGIDYWLTPPQSLIYFRSDNVVLNYTIFNYIYIK